MHETSKSIYTLKNKKDCVKVYVLFAYNTKRNKDLLTYKYLSIFPIEYRERIINYRRWQDIQASIIGRLLLAKGLKRFYNYKLDFSTIQNDSFKRPYLLNSKIDFNVSHSDGMVVCAITDSCRIGIDIEKITKIAVEDFFYQMTNLESERIITSENRKEEFFNYWTQKEAVLKAQGEGLYVPLKTFEVIKKEASLYGQKYYVNTLELDNQYVSHLASNNKIETNEILVKEIKI